MASASVPGVHSWGNLHPLLVLGASRRSPCYGGSLWAPFLLGRGGAGMADHMRLRVCLFPVSPRLVLHDVAVKSRFLGRPRLLTRL